MSNKLLNSNHSLARNLVWLLLIFPFFSLSCVRNSEKELCFAVIGDVHYRVPDFQSAIYLVPKVAEELHALETKPEFILQTGDFFHGTRGGDVQSESSFAFNNFAENFKLPFFIAKGNHDTRSYYEKEALPVFSGLLEKEITTSYYSFDKGNCHFIVLDCTEENLTKQLVWLEDDLRSASTNPKTDHIFVAGHYPLWIVARAGFTRADYALPVTSLLAKYKVDAYFCGHTHNKTVTVRLIDGQPLTQIMDAAVVEEGRLFNLSPWLNHVRQAPENPFQPGILSLEEAHQIFIPAHELVYYWGYQEGSSTTYNVITVKGKTVQADWYVLGKGLVRSFKWNEPGKIVDLIVPEKKEGTLVVADDLNQADQAWLYTAIWTSEESVRAPILINGVRAGELSLDKSTMAYSPFWNKIEVNIDNEALKSIKLENEISIGNPEKGKFGLAHILLLVEFKDGRFAKSTISEKVLTSFPEESGIANFPSSELVESVDLGMPLVNVRLKLERYILN